MSLSDYSSDSDGEAIPGDMHGVRTAAIGGRRRAEDGTSVGTAVAALALGGLAAGFLLWRYLSRKDSVKQEQQENEAASTGARRELRRKRPDPHTGESPRTTSTMLRSGSTSSVGPRRKQPRRDTSESATESGGEVSGASPKVARSKTLRKVSSSHSRRRPPQHRPAQPTLPAFQGLGSGSEAETAREEDTPAAAGSAPAGASGSPGMEEPQNPMQGGTAGGKEGEPKEAMPTKAERSDAESKERRETAPDASTALSGTSKAASKGPDLPDVFEPTSALASSQPSLQTFTADVDALDRAVNEVSHQAGTQPDGGVEQHVPGKAEGKGVNGAETGEKEKAVDEGQHASQGSEGGAEGGRRASADSAAAGPALDATPPKKPSQPEQDASLDLGSAETEVVTRAVEEAEGEPGQAEHAGADGDHAPGTSAKNAEEAGGKVADQAGTDQADGAPTTASAAERDGAGDSTKSVDTDAARSAAASLANDIPAEGGPVPLGVVAGSTEAAGAAEREAAEEEQSQPLKEPEPEPSQANSILEAGSNEDSGQPEQPDEITGREGKADEKESAGPTAEEGSDVKHAEDTAALDAVESAAADFDAAEKGSARAPALPAEEHLERQPSAVEASLHHEDDGAAALEHGTVTPDIQESGGGKEQDMDANTAAEGSTTNGGHDDADGIGAGDPSAYDPLALGKADVADAPEDNPDALANAPAPVDTEAAEDGSAMEPRCTDERDVELNLAVALRMIAERGNYAAAERTLQKQLGVIRGGQADAQGGGAGTKAEAESKPTAVSVRPQYACRLAGTLADVIARGEREAAALGHPSGQDRRGEIVDLLRYAFEAAQESGDGGLRFREAWRLAAALVEAEDLDSAAQLSKEELEYSEAQYGPADPRTHQSRTWLADIWLKQGNPEAACKLLKDAAVELQDMADKFKASQDKELRSNGGGQAQDLTPEVAARQTAAKCCVHLAQIQDSEKDYTAAKASACQGIALMEASFGKNNPRTSTAYGTLAAILKHEGTEGGLREALDLYKRLQAITEDIHGTKHQNNALAMRSIADINTMLSQHGEAATCNEKAAHVAGAVYGRDHPVLESYWRAVADSKQQMGDTEGARDANRRALHVRARSGAPAGNGRRGGGGGRRGAGRSTGRSSRH